MSSLVSTKGVSSTNTRAVEKLALRRCAVQQWNPTRNILTASDGRRTSKRLSDSLSKLFVISLLCTCDSPCAYFPNYQIGVDPHLTTGQVEKSPECIQRRQAVFTGSSWCSGSFQHQAFLPWAYGRGQQVLRQNSFTEKMHLLGWSRPGYFESKEDEIALHHCVARYHAYVQNGEEIAFQFADTLNKVPRSHSLRANLVLCTNPGH